MLLVEEVVDVDGLDFVLAQCLLLLQVLVDGPYLLVVVREVGLKAVLRMVVSGTYFEVTFLFFGLHVLLFIKNAGAPKVLRV